MKKFLVLGHPFFFDPISTGFSLAKRKKLRRHLSNMSNNSPRRTRLAKACKIEGNLLLVGAATALITGCSQKWWAPGKDSLERWENFFSEVKARGCRVTLNEHFEGGGYDYEYIGAPDFVVDDVASIEHDDMVRHVERERRESYVAIKLEVFMSADIPTASEEFHRHVTEHYTCSMHDYSAYFNFYHTDNGGDWSDNGVDYYVGIDEAARIVSTLRDFVKENGTCLGGYVNGSFVGCEVS